MILSDTYTKQGQVMLTTGFENMAVSLLSRIRVDFPPRPTVN